MDMIRNPLWWLLWCGGGIAWVMVAITTISADNGSLAISQLYDSVAETNPVIEQSEDGPLSLEEDTSLVTTPNDGVSNNIQRAEESQDSCIQINTAGVEVLKTLPGIGPVLAERIIAFRQEKGRFSCATDLIKVKGIGEAKLRKIAGLICF